MLCTIEMKLSYFCILALLSSVLAFPSVEEFEFEEEVIENEETDEVFDKKITLFDMVSKIEPNPKKATRLESFSWKDCGGAKSMVNINSISITPDPVKLPGPLNIAADFKIISNLDTPLKGTVLLYKEVVGKFVKIPCIDDIGSCTYDDLCELLEEVQCPDPIVKIGIECMCPLKTGSYSLPKTDFDVEVDTIPAGTYHALGNATMNGKEGACLDITLTLS